MNNDAVKAQGAADLALASLSHPGADGARPPAGAAAADRILTTIETIVVAGTYGTGIELGELATTRGATSSPAAGVEHRAVGVYLAGRGTTLALTAFRAWQTFDYRGGAETVHAGIRDARVIMLAPAVPTGCARGHAATVSADLVLGTTIRAGLLTDNDFWQPTPGDGSNCR